MRFGKDMAFAMSFFVRRRDSFALWKYARVPAHMLATEKLRSRRQRMEQLRTEYTDVKAVRHRVEHRTRPAADSTDRARLIEELVRVLQPQEQTPPKP